MDMYHYKLNDKVKKQYNRKYTREELLEMTTFQLRNICFEEKIVKGLINTLDREKLISIILKYRGKEDTFLINTYEEKGLENINKLLEKYILHSNSSQGEIKIPAKIILYPEIGISKEDKYKVITDKNVKETNVLLINDKNDLCGIFNLLEDHNEENTYYLSLEKSLKIEKSNNRNYSLLFFEKQDSEYIYKAYYSDKELPPINIKYYKTSIADIEIRELEETNAVLAIDFGTSNTSAGAYLSSNYVSDPCYNDVLNETIKLNEINFVKFMDITREEEKYIEILPTVIYVSNCENENDIKYYFGYEAQKHMKKNDYTYKSSVYQGIKRWINNYLDYEEIYDEEGNIANVTRASIIREYMKHVIETAEHQFKCRFKNIHISSPVKLKYQFIDMFKEILPEYNIESENAMDEGIAVLYNTIANQIENNNFEDGEEYKALIIDCGGGTTDLSSCSFVIEEGHISYKVYINTMYENGDTNFGGNNITYRIMQFMKIIFANYYKDRKYIVDIDDLIDVPSTDIFRYIDEVGIEKLYENFEKKYEEAEKVIPTRFKEYENRVKEEYQSVKNNFYFLWEIADKMKKEFFQRTNVLRNKFDSRKIEEESDLTVTALNKWSLSILDNEEFKLVHEFPSIIFNIKEIDKLIKGDIYEIVRKFLDNFYKDRTLQDYSIIKLTGQSCRINIFKEALKEFVPGKSIEFRQKKEDDESVSDLKLSCVKGVLRYLNSKKIGDIEVYINNEVPTVPHSISALTYNKQEKTLIYSLEKISQGRGFISRPMGVEEIEFYLKTPEGELKETYVYVNNLKEYKQISEDDIAQKYGDKVPQDDTDTIRNREIRFFVYSHERSWGFYVLPICRENDQLYIGENKYFAFENDLSELDFFDGRN